MSDGRMWSYFDLCPGGSLFFHLKVGINFGLFAWAVRRFENFFWVTGFLPHWCAFHVYIINPFSAGIDFRHQHLTSMYIRFRRLKSVSALKKHRYSNEVERANYICDDFKLKKSRWSLGLYNIFQRFNPLTAKLFDLNFHPLEVVSRWRDPQFQVSEIYSDLTKWKSTVFKYCWLMSHFILNMFKRWYLMRWKPEYIRHRRLKG